MVRLTQKVPIIQCDQMARLFNQFFVIFNNEKLPKKHTQFAKLNTLNVAKEYRHIWSHRHYPHQCLHKTIFS